MRIKVIASVVILIFVGSGLVLWSRSKRPEAGTMLKAWSESIQNLGVRAIYPLQEGLYPGNILLVPTYPGKARWFDEKPAEYYTKYMVKIGSLDPCQLYLSLQHVPEFDPITDYQSNDGKSVTPWQPTQMNYSDFKCGNTVEKDFRINRVMAFPTFQFGSSTDSDISANILNGVAGLFGGLVGNNEFRITVSIPSATVIKVDLFNLTLAMKMYNYNTPGGYKDVQELLGRMKKVQTFTDENGNESEPELLVVSEVYYANAIDISISSSAANATELKVNAQALSEQFDQLNNLRDQLRVMRADTSHQKGADQSQPKDEVLENSIKELSQQIAEKETEIDTMSKSILPGAPGVTGAVKSVSKSGVTMTQVFPRPLAFGYRAIGLKPDEYQRMQ